MLKAKLSFYGGVGMVTGSNFLLDIGGKRMLVDCGFFQGCNTCEVKTLSPFSYDPKSIDIVFVTHAHLDHTGRIPKLVREGFNGKIISTPPTRDIAELMYKDSVDLLEEEARAGGYDPIYGEEDIKKTMSLWETVSYHEPVALSDAVQVTLLDSGHILGSAMIEVRAGDSKLIFTGDLGNSPSPLLKPAEEITDATYVVMESVYGDRNHEEVSTRKKKLEKIIEDVVKVKGVLLIPAFSIERTQELLYEIKRLQLNYQIPLLPVYVDSPLAVAVTEVYKKYDGYYNKEVSGTVDSAKELFVFPQLQMVSSKEDSKAIWDRPDPKVIIAGSGMSQGGRIIFHEKRYLEDPKTTILFVGYQSPRSLGREILEGAKEVTIFDKLVRVHARVESILGYSAHKDLDNLLEFASHSGDTLKKVFVVMGEPKSSAFLAQRLRDYLGLDASVPKEGESVELDF